MQLIYKVKTTVKTALKESHQLFKSWYSGSLNITETSVFSCHRFVSNSHYDWGRI